MTDGQAGRQVFISTENSSCFVKMVYELGDVYSTVYTSPMNFTGTVYFIYLFFFWYQIRISGINTTFQNISNSNTRSIKRCERGGHTYF